MTLDEVKEMFPQFEWSDTSNIGDENLRPHFIGRRDKMVVVQIFPKDAGWDLRESNEEVWFRPKNADRCWVSIETLKRKLKLEAFE